MKLDLDKGEAFDLGRCIAWALFTAVAFVMDWLSSVVLVSLLSIWALSESAWGAYRARRDDQKEWRKEIDRKLDELLARTEG